MLRFTAPAEVKGVALLVVNHPDRASDQWMWTPAIERDRRIALQDRSTRFFGTDFSFEDLEERDVDQYDYALLGDETVDGAACWKIQSTPKQTKSSQYTRSIVWIRKDNYAFARIENYVKDQARAAAELLATSRTSRASGPRAQLEMTDLRRGSRTRLTLDKLRIQRAAEGRGLHAAGDPATVSVRRPRSTRALVLVVASLAAARRGRADADAARLRRRQRVPVSRRTRRTIRRSVVGDLLAREEVFVKPAPWLQFAGGLELRANSHDQVEDSLAPRSRRSRHAAAARCRCAA